MFDGHSGSACADFLKRQLQKNVLASLKWKSLQMQSKNDRFTTRRGLPRKFSVLAPEDVKASIEKVFHEVDNRFLEKSQKVQCRVFLGAPRFPRVAQMLTPMYVPWAVRSKIQAAQRRWWRSYSS